MANTGWEYPKDPTHTLEATSNDASLRIGGVDVLWNIGELYRRVENMGKRVTALEATREDTANRGEQNFASLSYRVSALESAAKPVTVEVPANAFKPTHDFTDPIEPSHIFYEQPTARSAAQVATEIADELSRREWRGGDEISDSAMKSLLAEYQNLTAREWQHRAEPDNLASGGTHQPKTADQIAVEITEAFRRSSCWEITPETTGFKEQIANLYDAYAKAKESSK